VQIMQKVECWVCRGKFEVYPSRYDLCKSKRFFCTRTCKDLAQVKTLEARLETKRTCNRRSRDQRYTERRIVFDEIKLKSGCVDCGYNTDGACC
jgi:hypothetical protein